MAKKSPNTTNTQIRAALRKLFLRSRERAARLKADCYTCQECGVKQSRAKGREVYVEVHHKRGVLNWQMVFDAIREGLLCDPENLERSAVNAIENPKTIFVMLGRRMNEKVYSRTQRKTEQGP